jgi:YfiH family protein
MIVPDWPAPARVRALVTTRGSGAPRLPAAPAWLRQVHGTGVVDAAGAAGEPEADASVARVPGVVCAVKAADCMPVLLADDAGGVVGAAHAGWRGLTAGVLEATIDAMRVPGQTLIAWLGPAIGPRAYEVGEEVRAAFLARDAQAAAAFAPSRPGHWLLDLYAVARQPRGARRDAHPRRQLLHILSRNAPRTAATSRASASRPSWLESRSP